MSFLDPYEKNRRISLITWLRLLVWLAILAVIALVWWLVAG
jgi:cytoskeletal protein RodZ